MILLLTQILYKIFRYNGLFSMIFPKRNLKMSHCCIFSANVSFVRRSAEFSAPEENELPELVEMEAFPKPVEWVALQLSPEELELFLNTQIKNFRLLLIKI